jgi:SAM-dependent methyltransferase
MSVDGVRAELPRTPLQAMVRRAKDSVREAIGRHAPYLVRRVTNFHRLEDRVLLETVILPFFRDQPEVRKILFVGTEWYTKPYERLFASQEYWTLEIDPANSRYGAKRHVIAPLKALTSYAPPDYFDAIIANGVFHSTAISTREEAEPSFRASLTCLRPGGWFLLGWNDHDQFRPYPPSESPTLAEFEPAIFPPFGKAEYRTDTEYRHVFSFFRKPR